MNKILNLLGADLKEKLESLGIEKFLDYLGDIMRKMGTGVSSLNHLE
jgi:hypothetical protein